MWHFHYVCVFFRAPVINNDRKRRRFFFVVDVRIILLKNKKNVCVCFVVQEMAELAVEQMQNMIHTFIRKGTTASLRTKVD